MTTPSSMSTPPPAPSPTRTGTAIGTGITVLGAAGVAVGCWLPNPIVFVVFALALATGLGLVVHATTRRGITSAIIAVVTAAALIAAPWSVTAVLAGADAEDVGSQAHVFVVDGVLYRSDSTSSADGARSRLERLNPADLSVEQSWTIPSYVWSLTSDGGVISIDTAPPRGSGTADPTTTTTTVISQDAAGKQVWRTEVEHAADADVSLTAASAGAAQIVACDPGDIPDPVSPSSLGDGETDGDGAGAGSAGTGDGCRLTTIDATGAIAATTTIGAEWHMTNPSWFELPGQVLPRATVTVDDHGRIVARSPSATAPVVRLSAAVTGAIQTSSLVKGRFITVEQPSADTCEVVGRDVTADGDDWSTPVTCNLRTALALWSTTDPDANPYLAAIDDSDIDGRRLYSVDAATGDVAEVADPFARPTSALVRLSRNPRELARLTTAGTWIIGTSGGTARIRGADGTSDQTVEVPGTVRAPASAAGGVVALISDTNEGDVPAAVDHNPALFSRWFGGDESRDPAPQFVTVVDAATGEELSSTLFTSQVSILKALPGGRVYVRCEDGRTALIG